jgi:tetratricopeptide (TPR) repeat protein
MSDFPNIVAPNSNLLAPSLDNNLSGIKAEKNDDSEEAIRLYEQNVSARFDGSHPYKRLAIIYHKQKRYDDEIRVLEVAVDVFSKLKRQDVPKKLEYFKERLKKAKELQER